MLIPVAPGRRLFVDVDGAGLVPDGPRMRAKPTLILLHGGPGFDHSSFKPLFAQLADVAQVVYVDHRGHGRSDPAPLDELTLDTHADDVVRLCDALGIGTPIVLGQSFGGFVAQRYLARHPEHPGKVILSSTSHRMRTERAVAMFGRLGGPAAADAARAWWDEPDETTWTRYEATCLPLYNTRPPADTDTSRRTIVKLDILLHFVRGERRTMNLAPGLAAARCPVLVLAGTMDPVCPVEDAREIAAAIPAPWSRLVEMEDAGHGTWRDRPDDALACLRDFIVAAA